MAGNPFIVSIRAVFIVTFSIASAVASSIWRWAVPFYEPLEYAWNIAFKATPDVPREPLPSADILLAPRQRSQTRSYLARRAQRLSDGLSAGCGLQLAV